MEQDHMPSKYQLARSRARRQRKAERARVLPPRPCPDAPQRNLQHLYVDPGMI